MRSKLSVSVPVYTCVSSVCFCFVWEFAACDCDAHAVLFPVSKYILDCYLLYLPSADWFIPLTFGIEEGVGWKYRNRTGRDLKRPPIPVYSKDPTRKDKTVKVSQSWDLVSECLTTPCFGISRIRSVKGPHSFRRVKSPRHRPPL